MRRSLACLAALVAVALFALPASAQTRLPADSLERARHYAKWFFTGEADSLLAVMTPEFVESIGGRAGLMEGLSMIGTRAGDELEVAEERWNWRGNARQYWRSSRVSILDDQFLLRLVLTSDGKLGGVGMGPLRNAPPVDSVGPAVPRP